MALKNIDGKLSAFEKFEIWFGRYAFIFFSVSFAVLLVLASFTYFVYYTESKKTQELLSVVDKLSKYGIFVTQDNRIVALEKTKIGNSFLQGAVKNMLVNDFILSRYSFYDTYGNFIRVNENNYKEFLSALITKSQDVNNLWNYFVKDDKDSLKTFYLYLKYLYELAKEGDLPDIIYPVNGVKVEYFRKVGRNGFSAKVVIPVVATYYDASGKLKEGRGTIVYEVSGEVNPIKTAEYYQKNPFGIIVKRLSTRYVSVSSLKRER